MDFYTLLVYGQPSRIPDIVNPPLPQLNRIFAKQLIMRINLTLVVLISALLQVSAAGYAQKINVSQKNVPLEEVFRQIQRQSGYKFLFADKVLDGTKPVTVELENASLQQALEKCFEGQPLTYVISRNTVIVKRKPSVPSLEKVQVTVTGKVVDEKGEPLPSVSILLKSTKIGTSTNIDGEYTINIPDENADGVLVFTFIGYEKLEIPINSQNRIDVTLKPDQKALDEVVVVGYGTQLKKTLTSSSSSIKPAEIQNVPNANLGNMLQGRAAGVQIIQNNGAPGGGPTIRIRGISSLQAGNDPLYIVDEVPIQGGLNDINPNDIESIEVLKDAAAVAIYGARAANGVVLITTKRGKGRNKITLSTSYGFQNITKKLELLESPELLQVMKEMYDNNGLPRDAFFNEIDTTVNTNWSDLVLQNNAPIRTIDLSANGGEGKVKYQTSINYFEQEGIVKQSGFDRITGRLNLDVDLSKKIRFGSNLAISNTRPQNIPNNGATNAGVYLNALVKNPLTPVYNPSGGYNFIELYGNTGHPLASLYEVDRNILNNRIFGNLFAEYQIIPELTFRTSWGLDYRTARNSNFNRTTSNPNGAASASFNNADDFQWINTNILTFKKTLAQVHDISATAIYEQQEYREGNSSASASQFPNDKVKTLNAAAKIDNASSDQTVYGLESLVGRVAYSYKNKYILSGNVRRDGSSKFGRNNRFGVFPSVSAAWNISDEPFMKGIPTINFLKIRGSVGQVGNQGGLSNFSARGIFQTGRDYAGEPGIGAGDLPNYDLKWENTTQYNVGIDIGAFNERIVFTADAYLKNTDELLLNRLVPPSSGTGAITVNIGKMENKGLEFNMTTLNLIGNFKWTTNFNLAANRNKIVTLVYTDLIQVFAQSRVFSANAIESLLLPGNPVGLLYIYETEGVYARDEDNTTGLRDQSPTGYLFKGGDVRYVDQNGDGIITPADRVPLGRPQPYHTGGITNTLSYKGLSLDVFMNWSFGNKVYNGTGQALTGMESPARNYLSVVNNRWRQQGDVTNIPRADTGEGNRNIYTSSRFLEDGSYLRINNVTLAYQFPQKFVNRIKFQNMRAFITANNLAILTNYSGIDPDVRSFTREGSYGVDLGAYPRTRTFTLGLTAGL